MVYCGLSSFYQLLRSSMSFKLSAERVLTYSLAQELYSALRNLTLYHNPSRYRVAARINSSFVEISTLRMLTLSHNLPRYRVAARAD